MKNKSVRAAIEKAGLHHWEVAEEMNIADTTLCRWLRTELPAEKKTAILSAIDRLKKKG